MALLFFPSGTERKVRELVRMTTKDKLEFVHLMTKHSSASLSDMQRLLRFAAAYQALVREWRWTQRPHPETYRSLVRFVLSRIVSLMAVEFLIRFSRNDTGGAGMSDIPSVFLCLHFCAQYLLDRYCSLARYGNSQEGGKPMSEEYEKAVEMRSNVTRTWTNICALAPRMNFTSAAGQKLLGSAPSQWVDRNATNSFFALTLGCNDSFARWSARAIIARLRRYRGT